MTRATILRISLLFAILAPNGLSLRAQTRSIESSPVRSMPPVAVSFSSVLQNWTRADTDIYELSTTASLQMQVLPSLNLRISASQATAEHDSLQKVTGMTDIQTALSYVVKFPSSRLSLSLNANLPTGKKDLSKWAYDAAFPMSLSQYDFQVPYFGRGTSVSPGIAWAFSASRSLVLGLGASYHVRGEFQPHRALPGKYDWGNEFTLTTGAEWQPSLNVFVSTDLILTLYAADKINGIEVYSAGSRFIGSLRASSRIGRNDLSFSIRFRTVGTNQSLSPASIQPESVTASTGVLGAAVTYRLRVSPFFYSDFQVSATQYSKTFDVQNIQPSELIPYDQILKIGQLNVYGVGFFPRISIAPAVSIPIRLKYSVGDITGFETGIGLAAIL
ncbi:MAG: hypothetical protein BMS9Abin05_1025 [Rhodothermia bacterium]|nr:MAG: hypothetical protein BMS9Abin05_1025 [Rhodothermia bacterium]